MLLEMRILLRNHFYEQGKADAVKILQAKSKNINNRSRAQQAPGEMFSLDGYKVKAISGDDSSKIENKNKKLNTKNYQIMGFVVKLLQELVARLASTFQSQRK